MTVVSNMSPLHYLILINCEHILPLLYGQVFTPPAVIEEMRAPNTPEVVRRWIDSPPEWLKIVEPANIEDIPRLGQGKRGAGEKASIALAREIQADALFIDDKKGIQEAQKRGLKAVRMLTIVDRAAERDRSGVVASGPLCREPPGACAAAPPGRVASEGDPPEGSAAGAPCDRRAEGVRAADAEVGKGS